MQRLEKRRNVIINEPLLLENCASLLRMDNREHSSLQLAFTDVVFKTVGCSVQFKMVSICMDTPLCTWPHLSEVSLVLPLKQFQSLYDWRWPFLALARKITERYLCLWLLPPGDRCCDVLGFVPSGSGSVSSSSTLQMFWYASLCDRYFAHQSISSVISFDCSMLRTVHPQVYLNTTKCKSWIPFHVTQWV